MEVARKAPEDGAKYGWEFVEPEPRRLDGNGWPYTHLALKRGTHGGTWPGREVGRGRIRVRATVGYPERSQMARRGNEGSVLSGPTGWTRPLWVTTAPCAPPTAIGNGPR